MRRLAREFRARLRRRATRNGRLKLYQKYRDATMVPVEDFLLNLEVASRTSDVAGAVVECGTWRGGMSAALMEICGDRQYHFFDSFEGLPPAQEIDGQPAINYQTEKASRWYYDNCSASLEEFQETISRAPQRRVHVHKGWFNETLPKADISKIAVLRLDGDWYDSTMTCLEYLFDRVVPGGVVLIDDYYAWDGCSRAVHDFLSKRNATERLRQLGRLAFIGKA